MPVNKLNLLIYEIIEKVGKARSKEQKIKILKENENWALKDILLGTYSEGIEFNLPPGEPPYKASQGHNAPTNCFNYCSLFEEISLKYTLVNFLKS